MFYLVKNALFRFFMVFFKFFNNTIFKIIVAILQFHSAVSNESKHHYVFI